MSGLAAEAKSDRALLAIALMLAAYLAFSFIDTSANWLALAGLAPLQLAFMRYFAHFIISSGILLRSGIDRDTFAAEKLPLVVLRGGLLAASTILNFFAITFIPLTLTSTILFAAPIMICALSWPLLGERVGVWRWSAILAGFCGILVAIRPFDESFHWAVFLSLGGAFCFAMYSILTRKLAGIVATDTMQFYSGLVGAAALLPAAVLLWQNPATLFEWCVMFALGFFGWFGHQLLTTAHRFASASMLTPFAYAFIVYLTIWSILVFDEAPDRWTITGAAIIVAAGLVIWFRERHKAIERVSERTYSKS